MNTKPDNKMNQTKAESKPEINLAALLGALIDRKYFIVVVTALFLIAGVIYATFSTPVYQANAMIQVEDGGASVPGFDDMAGMFESTSAAVTEVELLKSRSVIGEAVDSLQLDLSVEPKLFPFIGAHFFRKFSPIKENELAEPRFGAESYAWGGESIDIFRFDVPRRAIGTTFTLVTGANNDFSLINSEKEEILQGKVGEELTNNLFNLTVRGLNARPGTEFLLVRKDKLNTIIDLQSSILAIEKVRDSGIVDLSLQSSKPSYAEKVLNKVAAIYVRRNVERNSAEAQKSA